MERAAKIGGEVCRHIMRSLILSATRSALAMMVQRRVHRADRRKEAGIGEIKIVEFMCLAIQIKHGSRRVSSETCGPCLMRRSANGNVFAKIEIALQQNGMGADFTQHLFQFLFQTMMRFHIAFGDLQQHTLAVIPDAIFGTWQIFARQPEVHRMPRHLLERHLRCPFSHPGNASPRICAPCDVAHIWIRPSG